MAHSPAVQHITPRKYSILSIKELWEYRELFYYFAWRDIKVRYKQTMLGLAWALLQPLVQVVVFTFVLAIIRGGGEATNSYNIPQPLFLVVGIVLWNAFAQGLSNSASSLNTNAAMLKKIFFPKIILPFSSVVVVFFDMLMGLGILAGIFIFFGFMPHPLFFLMLLVGIIITFITTTGLGMLLSAISVKYRDFKYVIPFAIQLLFWLTPVMYQASSTEGYFITYLIKANPVSGAIEMARMGVIGQLPEPTTLLLSFGMSCVFFFLGMLYFKRTEYYFADIS